MTPLEKWYEEGYGFRVAFPLFHDEQHRMNHNAYHLAFFMPDHAQGDYRFGISMCGIEFKLERQFDRQVIMLCTDSHLVDCVLCLRFKRDLCDTRIRLIIEKACFERTKRRQLQVFVSKELLEKYPHLAGEQVNRDQNDNIIRPTGEQK